tara:strand:- start:430 stop:633 length:204 start_codon:yes stop_codon:yes gene_type:complete
MTPTDVIKEIEEFKYDKEYSIEWKDDEGNKYKYHRKGIIWVYKILDKEFNLKEYKDSDGEIVMSFKK